MSNTIVLQAQSTQSSGKGRLLPSKNGLVYGANISIGEGYGLIPYQTDPMPSFYFKSEGNLGIQLGFVPISITYAFSDVSRNSNSNFIHFSFDVNKFRALQKEALKKYKDSLDNKLSSQQLLRQSLLKRKFNSDLLLDSATYMNAVRIQPIHDSIWDSARDDIPLGFEPSSTRKDSIQNANKLLNDSIKLLEKSIQKLEQAQFYYKNAIAAGNFVLNPSTNFSLEKLLNGFQKLEIGRCSPNNSAFLISGVRMKGISAEYEQNNVYWTGAIGKTSELYNAPNIGNPISQFADNFNFLRFSDFSDGKRIVSIKGGYGKKEASHIYIGGLWSAGYSSSYYYAQNEPKVLEVEKNRVYEIDGRIVAGGLVVDLVGAKSAVFSTKDNIETQDHRTKSNQFLKNSAATGKLSYNFSKINLNVELGGKWAAPFFRSFGIGFINNDNLRFDLKSSKSFGKKEKLTIFYRKERSNLSHYLTNTSIIESFGFTNHYKINRRLQFHVDVRPTIIRSFANDIENYKSSNSSASTSLMYFISGKKAPGSIGLIYSYNRFNTPVLTTIYQSLTNSISFSPIEHLGINNNLSFSQQRRIEELNGIDNYMVEEVRVDWQLKEKLKTTVYLKFSRSTHSKSLGGGLKCSYAIMKKIDAGMSIDKFVQSDVISYLKEDYSRYPYNMFLQLKYHW